MRYKELAIKKPSEVLRKAKGLIDRPEKWFGPPGWRTLEQGAGNNCAGTAIYMEARGTSYPLCNWDTTEHRLFERANIIERDHIALWNNAPERTHAEVMQAFDRAIALAEKEEGKESDSAWAKRKVAEVTRVKEAA